MKGDAKVKLNPDCVRDILLTVEEKTDIDNFIDFPSELPVCKLLSNYTENEVRYHLNQCEMSGLIVIGRKNYDGDISITDLTPSGHELLSDIRSDTTWNRVKEKSGKIGSDSIRVIKDIAVSVVTELIKSQL